MAELHKTWGSIKKRMLRIIPAAAKKREPKVAWKVSMCMDFQLLHLFNNKVIIVHWVGLIVCVGQVTNIPRAFFL